MALHSFNIKYRYNLIPLYNLTSLVYYYCFSLFVFFLFYRYEFMIHFGFSTYTFPILTLTANPRSHDSHLSPCYHS